MIKIKAASEENIEILQQLKTKQQEISKRTAFKTYKMTNVEAWVWNLVSESENLNEFSPNMWSMAQYYINELDMKTSQNTE